MKCRSYTLSLDMDSPILHLPLNDTNSTKWWSPQRTSASRSSSAMAVNLGSLPSPSDARCWFRVLIDTPSISAISVHLKENSRKYKICSREIMNLGLPTLPCSLWHWYVSDSSTLFFSKSCSCKASKFLLMSSSWPLKLAATPPMLSSLIADKSQRNWSIASSRRAVFVTSCSKSTRTGSKPTINCALCHPWCIVSTKENEWKRWMCRKSLPTTKKGDMECPL